MTDRDTRGNRLELNPGERARSGNRNSTFTKPRAAKGHDAQLKDAQENGKPVTVTTLAGEEIKGNISNRDRYTITIRSGDNYGIYYKHAIESIYITQPTLVA